ncbi:hypothetical protein PVAP13_8KG023340 [Panicum virgatum]|uniref:Uncharacterized protein n=1 Tax=Panicum virgatum TaxID=38727 RepID=A0A8T0PCT0_PANVG|nr:hypothetical protein PVAP13_8KG023340 [Panicum virgatum]
MPSLRRRPLRTPSPAARGWAAAACGTELRGAPSSCSDSAGAGLGNARREAGQATAAQGAETRRQREGRPWRRAGRAAAARGAELQRRREGRPRCAVRRRMGRVA